MIMGSSYCLGIVPNFTIGDTIWYNTLWYAFISVSTVRSAKTANPNPLPSTIVWYQKGEARLAFLNADWFTDNCHLSMQ